MEVEVVESRDNPLLSRREIIVKVSAEATPSRKDVKELVAAKTGANPSLIVVKKIGGRSGSHDFFAEVYIYQDENTMKTLEPKYILRRNGVVEDGEAQPQ